MSSESMNYFNKDNLDICLKELAKEFRKLNGTAMSAEIILIGGAAVLANYQFRDMTTDVDAVIHASSSMKDAINRVGDKFGLPNGWFNTDFIRTGSYSPKLDEVSEYYKTFSNILQIRTVSAEYLIAMKLRSGRKYKNDLSDIIGILAEHEKRGNSITLEMIDAAVQTLYDSWADIPTDAKAFIEGAFRNGNYEEVYESIREEENHSKDILISFERDFPGVTTEDNVDDILAALKAKKPSVLEKHLNAERSTTGKTPPKKKHNEPER